MKNKYCILIPSFNSKKEDVDKTFSEIDIDCHVLVVDDGSNHAFGIRFKDLLSKYSNLKIMRIENNVGIEEALKLGTESLISDFEYIARLDIGDISPSNRYQKQVKFLDEHPDYVLVGAWGNYVDPQGKSQFISELPSDDNLIRKMMYINNMFIHPAVMIRSETLSSCGGYRKKFESCEDYDLFFRMLKCGKVANLSEVLIDYEINFSSISSKKRNIQVFNRLRIIICNFSFFSSGLYPYYGVLRNLLMLVISRKATTKFRTLLKR